MRATARISLARSRWSLIVVKNSTIFEISNTVVDLGEPLSVFPSITDSSTIKLNQQTGRKSMRRAVNNKLLFSPPRCWWEVSLPLAAVCWVVWLGAEAARAAAMQRSGRGGLALGASALPAAGRRQQRPVRGTGRWEPDDHRPSGDALQPGRRPDVVRSAESL